MRERIQGELEPAERAAGSAPRDRYGFAGFADRAAPQLVRWESRYRRKRRAEALAEWHLLLLDRVDGPETGQLLDKLVAHPAIEGPERTLLAARLAQRRGDQDRARDLVRTVLEELPGHQEALAFAAETGAVPARD